MEQLLAPYAQYDTSDIIAEVLAIVFAIISVWYSKSNRVWVYPTGIVNAGLYVYLLYKWNLYGDLIVNLYYLVMSLWGWYNWSRFTLDDSQLRISKLNSLDYKNACILYIISSIFVIILYLLFDKFGFWWSYVDILTTGLFFVGMYFLAQRKVEHWLFLLSANLVSIPLYYYKGYSLTSILYIVYSVIAVAGYIQWKAIWKKNLELQ